MGPTALTACIVARSHWCAVVGLQATSLSNPVTGLPQISEVRILDVVKNLSEDIGYRTVGTLEHALADKYMVAQAEEVKKNCEKLVAESGRKLECEVWRQEGSGSHRFDMMGKRLYKTYVNLTNIIVRVSDGTPEGKEHAVLVNSHLDSTLPSPGAADDAISVGVMLECMRVLIETPTWSPKHAIIFLFNHAEECLQDGSHLYSTQHSTAPTVRAAINLEAAGTTGRELLFQATSEEMIKAYSQVPRPYGTTFANDIFSSGIILSDTDFRQFETYLNVTGLDMAIIGNSYLYHMRKDLVENIEIGVGQHMAENALALLTYLSAPGSPLPSLNKGYSPVSTVYFAHIGGLFFMYTFTTAKILYTFLFAASLILRAGGFFQEQRKGIIAVVAGAVGTMLVPNIVALVMRFVLKKGLSWFSNPFAPMALYGPAALLGELLGHLHEKTVFTSLLLMQSGLAILVQLLKVGSAAMFFLSALPLFVVLLINPLFSGNTKTISLATYFLGQICPLLTGSLLTIPTIEVFVPLMGRVGAQAPADNMIASLVSGLGAQSLPLVLPLAHRFGRRALLRGVLLLSMTTFVLMGIFAMRTPFDEMHQKRLFVLHLENITSQERHLHLAAADGAPGFELLVQDIVKDFGATDVAPTPVVMDDYNSDWDTLYPFSTFLTPYKVPLAMEPGYVSPWVKEQAFVVSADNDVKDLVAGTRSLTIKVDHPGLIWTTIAFDAHVLKWSLDDSPPNEHARHHVKEASFYGTDTYTFDMVIKLTNDPGLSVNFIGVQEKGMWPGKKSVKAEGGLAMRLFEELDSWLDVKTGGTVDALLMGCVAGSVIV
ncbi:hypothetical protein K443DRAFT_134254 [Laccaria amethystina LaAM-08-1]|uniref:Peptide hydrolase n=1 Tax=Laccaria amethystina LaAM-08-1 TaxID=1095629 RepID=A0A0C9WUQ2_9AGAR|nr:hypothetical protein K443DRAFT_134254 [Laccaria amethystina LaAM-08-1]